MHTEVRQSLVELMTNCFILLHLYSYIVHCNYHDNIIMRSLLSTLYIGATSRENLSSGFATR